MQNNLFNRVAGSCFSHRDEPIKNSAPEQFSFVIAYNDLTAARRGMRVIANLARRGTESTLWRPLPWRFDFLEHPFCRLRAVEDAVNADLIVISTNAPQGLPPAVHTWMEATLERKRGDHAAVVALLGPSEHLDGPGSARFDYLRQATEAAGLDFFAPFSDHDDRFNLETADSASWSEAGPREALRNVRDGADTWV